MSIDPFVVLLVDGNREHAETIRGGLSGHQVPSIIHHVAEESSALDFLLKRGVFADSDVTRPHVILLDRTLNEDNGLGLLRKIKEDAELSSIPVVVLTETLEQSDLHRALECQANSFLIRPTDRSECRQLIDDLKLFWPENAFSV